MRQRLGRKQQPSFGSGHGVREAPPAADGYSLSLADKVFTFDISAKPLAVCEFLRYTVAGGRVRITLNVSHPAARFLLSDGDQSHLPAPTAMMCAALVALEVETTNAKRRSLYRDAREDLGRLLRHLRPLSTSTK